LYLAEIIAARLTLQLLARGATTGKISTNSANAIRGRNFMAFDLLDYCAGRQIRRALRRTMVQKVVRAVSRCLCYAARDFSI